jgi:CRP/FNR family transcriptional activator FtrB
MALRDADAERVRSLSLFKDVGDAPLSALLKAASIRQFPTRCRLFIEGEQATTLYIPIEGAVELFNENHVRRSTVALIRSPRPFPLTSLAVDRNLLSARTLERSELVLLPLDVVHELIHADAAFARAMLNDMACYLCDIVEHFKNHRLRPGIERLAEWMVRSDQDAGGTGRFVIPYDKRTLASYLGMAPENLSRSLVSLASVGVSVQGRSVSLNDRAALAALARIESVASPETCASLAPSSEPA